MDSGVPLDPLPRRGLPEEAASSIRDAILSGGFEPGSPLREVELATMLGISRGSVRDGLGILEVEGLITRGWHRATRVIDVTTEDVTEVYAVRAALDRLAATTARDNATVDDLEALTSIVDAMESAAKLPARRSELVGLDIQFHDRIYEAADNRRLSDAWRAIRSQIHLFHLARVEKSEHDFRNRILPEHRRFVELLAHGTKDEVAREAENHVLAARDTLLRAIEVDVT